MSMLFRWPDDGLRLPPLDSRITGATLLNGGACGLWQNGSGIEISAPKEQRNRRLSVVALRFRD
ncbi:MAG: hypothetical protein JJU05_09855 [Verrucomicrobia bacterium]|nr:hypothetical protein [Verrucomicrobiota bacterium]MCH8527547.1 hypothetical protein [Kiritimatiellia bacterium]